MIDKFYNFLVEVDKDFPTPLSDRVNLYEYAKKLASSAVVSAIFNENKILGMVALYCNDTEKGYAYVPLVAVLPEARGRKISRALMASAVSIARDNNFKIIGIHTENSIALHLYESLGFKIKEGEKRKYLELELY